MSTLFADPAMSAALWIIIKASVLLGIAAIAQAVLRQRASAEIRHLVSTLAIVGLLSLPILSLALPGWAVVIRTARNTADVPVVITGMQEQVNSGRPSALLGAAGADPVSSVQPAGRISASTVIATVYAAGVLVMLMPLVMQWRNVQRLAREASEVQDSEWTQLLNECAGSMGVHRPVRLLRSRERSMPMAWAAGDRRLGPP